MVDINEFIEEINQKMTPKKAYKLNKKVESVLKSDKYSQEEKERLKNEALLEPLKILASCN